MVDYGHLFDNGMQLWGAASINTDFSKLAQYGIGIYASAYLEINLSGSEHHQQLSLPGLGPNGGPLVQNYDLQPYTFAIAAAGKLSLGVPGGGPTLMKMNGGFFIGLSENTQTIYVTGTDPVRPGAGLLIIRTGNINPLRARSTASRACSPSDSPTRCRSRDREPLLGQRLRDDHVQHDSGEPDVRDPADVPAAAAGRRPDDDHVYGGTPGPRASPCGRAAGRLPSRDDPGSADDRRRADAQRLPADQRRGDHRSDTQLTVTGAVGTTIPFLGAMTGQIYFMIDVGTSTPGVVGRVALQLGSNQIPGVQFDGQFLLEINTYGTDKRSRRSTPTAAAAHSRASTLRSDSNATTTASRADSASGASPHRPMSPPGPRSTCTWAAS